MPNPQKRKGDSFELRCAKAVSELTGLDVRRALGAGRADDIGDLWGIPDWTIQCKSYKNVTTAMREAVAGSERQQRNAGTAYGAGMVNARGRIIVVQSIEQWCATLGDTL
jgi:hypothetical protein